MTEDPKVILPADIVGYAEVFECCANMVAESEHPRLAATMFLNMSLTIALEVLGQEKLNRDLRLAIDNLPGASARARGAMN